MSLPHSKKRRLIILIIIIYNRITDALDKDDGDSETVWTIRVDLLDLLKPQMEIDEDSWNGAKQDAWDAADDICTALDPANVEPAEETVDGLFDTLISAVAALPGT